MTLQSYHASVGGEVEGNVIFAMICFPYTFSIMFDITSLI